MPDKEKMQRVSKKSPYVLRPAYGQQNERLTNDILKRTSGQLLN